MVSGLIAAVRRRSERRRRVPVPHARTLEDETSFTAEPGQPDDGGDARRRARKEHTARQAERARQRREDDRRDSGDARARAPRATDCDQREQGTRARPPAPAKITARVRPEGEHEGGKGGAPRGRGGGRGTRPRETERTTPPHRQPNAETAASDSARRRAAGAKQGAEAGRQPAEGTQNRARPAAKPPRPTTERRPAGAEAAPPRPTPQHGANHASGRRHGGETDGDGAGRADRTRKPSRRPRHQRKKTAKQDATARAADAEGANHGGHGRQHARTPGGDALRERADGQRAESATSQRQIGGRARDSPDKAAEGSGRSGGAPTANQTPRPTRTQRAARPIVARRCGHFRAGGKRGTLPSAYPLPSLARFTGMGGVIHLELKKNAQKGEKAFDLGLVLCALIVLYLFGGV